MSERLNLGWISILNIRTSKSIVIENEIGTELRIKKSDLSKVIKFLKPIVVDKDEENEH